ncbi:hypothetical protein SLEP1_g48558 [Rubroshorea leprosula]|uniref:Secreted protein n=1 Tax=Rubroshorea leprosula TaxID=152421 RepID=A0AAV5LU16_9ROSI|nr:hypothetical protein SLEP1_g48558 [Rubroshorea leprosula]
MNCFFFFFFFFLSSSSDPHALLFLFSPRPSAPNEPRYRPPLFPAGNPAKLGDFSLFSCLRTPVEPRKSQICVFFPLLSVGFNLWV